MLAAILALVLTPVAGRLARQYGAAHSPRERDVHQEPIPRWGGVSIYLAFFTTLLVGAAIFHFVLRQPLSASTLRNGLGLFLAGTVLTVFGAVDDRWDIPAAWQFLVQIICAGIVIHFGIRVQVLSNPLETEGMIFLGWLSIPLTILWLVGVTNAMNWIDGIDGLAAGVGAIAAGTMSIMAIQGAQLHPAVAVLSGALCGALIGFLRYNFHPAKIFMGGGAPFLGFTLAAISTVGAFKSPVAATMLVPLLVLALPLLDTAVVVIKRWRAGQPIHEADQSHIHHRLLALGFSQKKTVLILYTVSLGLSLAALGTFLYLGR